MSPQHRATLIGSGAIFLWGALALLTRLTEGRIPPFQMMAMTFSLAFLLMLGRWCGQGHLGLRHLRQPPLAWLLGVAGYFGYHFCYFLAMRLAPAVEVSLLAYLWPLLIVLLAALLPGERLRPRYLAGALLALAGCWLLVGGGGSGFNPDYLAGYLLALACALIWSGYSVLSRLLRRVPTDAVGWFCAATAVLALLLHLAWETTVWPQGGGQWIGMVGLGLGPVGIAFFAWDHGIKHGDLQLLGVLAYAAPLISTLLLLITGEASPSWTLLLACLAIVAGSLMAGHRGRAVEDKSVAVEG
ncbi:DMT family transporter [Sedimenticola hydrogenitrophicus]|uniref:aromatic amino acid exporter YddG n=1 Tax=Sedimenticola hydrogenitrophicus TaxID=2967975 RepID=UPI0023AEA014|nr:DMT family transporter [Sedimenticola hydrogenitrophicus]